MVIPAGALVTPTVITINQGDGSGFPAGALVTEIGPTGTHFAKPVTVTVKYLQQYLTANGITDPTTLKIVSADPGLANETLRTLAQDIANHSISSQTTHFSSFAALGYSNASLSGTYTMVEYSRSPNNTIVPIPFLIPSVPFVGSVGVNFESAGFTVELTTATFDGSGHVSATSIRNQDGVISTPAPVTANYSVDPDGTLTVDGQLKGSVLAGGSTFVLNSTGSNNEPQIDIGLKQGGSFSNASLSGTYTITEYARRTGPTNVVIPKNVPSVPISGNLGFNVLPKGWESDLITANFDGAGGVTVRQQISNRDGVVSNTGPQAATYSVASDGTLVLAGSLRGTVLAGGSSFLVADISGGDEPQFDVGIRKAGEFSNASLAGTYTLIEYARANVPTPEQIPFNVPSVPFNVNLSANFQPRGFRSDLITATFDGAGGVSVTQTRTNRDGVITNEAPQNASYSVSADGTLTLAGNLSGTVLAGGSSFILTSTTNGDEPQFNMGILK